MKIKKMLGVFGSVAAFILPAASALATGTAPAFTLTAPSGAIPATTCLGSLPQGIVQLLFFIGLIIAVIFLIYGGIKWVISGGDKGAVEAARGHIIAAIIGIVIIAAAFFIVSVVFQLLGFGNPLNSLSVTSIFGAKSLNAAGCTP